MMNNEGDEAPPSGTPMDGLKEIARISFTLMLTSFVLGRFSLNGIFLRLYLFPIRSTIRDHHQSSQTLCPSQKKWQYLGLLFHFSFSSRISIDIDSSRWSDLLETILFFSIFRKSKLRFFYPICAPAICLYAMLD